MLCLLKGVLRGEVDLTDGIEQVQIVQLQVRERWLFLDAHLGDELLILLLNIIMLCLVFIH